MESSEVEALIECLVANPHDTDALSRAHQQGAADPQAYAYLLEQVGTRTEDPSYASHWLSEAANIWSVTLGDAHRAARVLMIAVDRDPTQPLAADRLAQLYRDKGDVKALVAMLDRRVRLLTPMLGGKAPGATPESDDALRGLVAGLHEELGKLWNEAPLEQPRKAIDHYKRSIELDPTAAFAIFSVREIYKSLQQWDEAISMYAMELAVERDPERRQMLFRDEAATRRLAGDLAGVTQALRGALDELRSQGGDDPALAQELAGSLLDRADARAPLDERERAYGADLLAGLAESFGGEHGLAYASGALDLVPGHDRAMQLFAYYATEGLAPGAPSPHSEAISLRYHAYLAANPSGPLASDARMHLAASYEAIGQITQAIQVLRPLRGQPAIDQRLAALREQAPAGAGEETYPNADDAEPIDTEEVAEVARPSTENLKQASLDAARARVSKGDKKGALEHYLDVLSKDPVEPEALSWVEDYLRTKRDYAKLRDVLWASARATGAQDSVESRKLRLREIAGLSESNLKDIDGAVQAWRQILSLDRGDDAARQALIRTLEKGQRWDDLANVYEQEASASSDDDVKIQLEKKLATLHDQKRKDPLAAAEAWTRIANLTPEDDHAIVTAADLFEKAGKADLSATVIEEHAEGVTDVKARALLLDRLGRLQTAAGDQAAAGEAYERAAKLVPTVERWTLSEKAFATGQTWLAAANAAEQMGELAGVDAPPAKADALARAAGYLRDGGDLEGAIARLEQAHALVPNVEKHALALIEQYRSGGEPLKLARLLVVRGEGHADKAVRLEALREAAKLYEGDALEDKDAARAQWEKVLAAGEDKEALEHLVDLAVEREEPGVAAALLRRLGELATTKEDKLAVALREAALLSSDPTTVGAAVERYEWILGKIDPTSRAALRAIADLEEKREAPKAAANALERELALTTVPAERRDVGVRLVRNYESAKDDAGTFTALEVVRAADPEDFDTLNRLAALAEKLERWEPLTELLAQQIEVEADDNEISTLTQKRSALLADKLGRGDEALAALQELADAGDRPVRDVYVALGDRLGWRGIVATKLVDWWFPEAQSPARTTALAGAFERFALVGRDADAVRVGIEILRSERGGERSESLAKQLEELAAKTSDEAGLTAAQEVLGVELNGEPRAAELVRQAEMRVRAGMAWPESVQHGETALGGLTFEETLPLLARLAAMIPAAGGATAVVDLYERQVSRSRGNEAREKALSKAAQVAGERGELKRARAFFELAVTGTPSDATLDALVKAATEGDGDRDGLRRALAEAMAHGGEGVRDGGRSRANFLRRAAILADRELHDVDQAFAWLTDALVAHADAAALDTLTDLADAVKAPRRVDEVITRVLTEVFDGPLVRLLLARRAKVRKELLGDRVGAAADLKKLHDLSPTDEAVMAELLALLIEQGDHRAIIQLYEDQILRSKDQAARAELGRKVAQIWEAELADAREAADAWRRVLRLKPGDEEATQGLDRAKTNMLRKGPAPAVTPAAPAVPSAGAGAAVGEATVAKNDEAEEEAPSSVEDVDELDLEPEATDAVEKASPDPRALQKPVGIAEGFTEGDNTHTSIDVRPTLAAAKKLEAASTAAAPSSPAINGPASSGRLSKPPPLPTSYETNDPPTAPGRRMDATLTGVAGSKRVPISDRALAMTDENAPVDFAALTDAGSTAAFRDSDRPAEVPPDVLSATDLAALDDDEDEAVNKDVLVVDEFVEDVDDEYEDVAEPSKPHGPLPQ
jgi:hypothetical protein